ncbi:SufS family cysteine desulfurase [Actinotignum urinale]|uniref:SufS family cysteine desulfurase n=1 Tax=Actinotignum urinale TaxID=190146 RepID=UPI00370D1685
MTLRKVAEDFPILSREGRGGTRLVYLDTGATSLRPRQVMEAMASFESTSYGAVNRGSHILAEESTLEVEDARVSVAQFVGADPEEIVWTHGTTEGLNLLAYAIHNAQWDMGIRGSERYRVGPGDTVVVTRVEHHANLLPWQELCRKTGAQLRWLDVDEYGRINTDTLNVIDENTKIVAFTHVSNVVGAVSPVGKIVDKAREVGAITVLDACQSVPHMPVDFHALGVDFAVFSGHKMYGPTGVGVLYGKRSMLRKLPPFLTGGSMIDYVTMEHTEYSAPPRRFEAGTQPVTQIIGLAAAVDYLTRIGMDKVREHETHLIRRALEGMKNIPGIRILGGPDVSDHSGLISFDVEGVHPHDVGQFFDAQGICVRVGHHCAQPVHDFFNVQASTRLSLGVYNTQEDIDAFLQALAEVRGYFCGKRA